MVQLLKVIIKEPTRFLFPLPHPRSHKMAAVPQVEGGRVKRTKSPPFKAVLSYSGETFGHNSGIGHPYLPGWLGRGSALVWGLSSRGRKGRSGLEKVLSEPPTASATTFNR